MGYYFTVIIYFYVIFTVNIAKFPKFCLVAFFGEGEKGGGGDESGWRGEGKGRAWGE